MEMFNYWIAEYKKLLGLDGDIDLPKLAKDIAMHLDTKHEVFTDGYSFITKNKL